MQAGKWDALYKGATEQRRYGEHDVTYQVAANWLAGLTVEDWGCGLGWFRKFHQGPYTGVDGSHSRFADKIAELTEYKSECEGILLRHVLEHNADWETVLSNALQSCTKRMAIVLFIPVGSQTKVLNTATLPGGHVVPNVQLDGVRLGQLIGPHLKETGTASRKTEYNAEWWYLLEFNETP